MGRGSGAANPESILYGDDAPRGRPREEQPYHYPFFVGAKVIINSPADTKEHGKEAEITGTLGTREEGSLQDFYEVKIKGRVKTKTTAKSTAALLPGSCRFSPRQRVMTPQGVGIFIGVSENNENPEQLNYNVILEHFMDAAVLDELAKDKYYPEAYLQSEAFEEHQISEMAS